MIPLRSKAKQALWLTLFILAAAVAVLALYRPSQIIQVPDSRLKILSAHVLQNKNEAFYVGNQVVGQVRDFLRHRVGLTWVRPPQNLRMLFFIEQQEHNQQGTFILAVWYQWNGAPGDVSGSCPELVDALGKTIPAGGYFFGGKYWGDPQLGVWFLKPGSTNWDQYRLRPK